MIKKLVITGLLSAIIFSCEKPKDGEDFWGIWNSGKITSEKYAYTIPYLEKYYKVEDGYTMISRKKNYKGVIRNHLSENLFITEISGKYPIYNLKVKLIDNSIVNNKEVEECYYGDIKVHFIDKNTIWFENQLSKELNDIFKGRYFSLKFGPEKLFYRAERVEKPIPKNKGELE